MGCSVGFKKCIGVAAGVPPRTPPGELTTLPQSQTSYSVGEGDTRPNAPPLGDSILAPSALRSSCPRVSLHGAPADLELTYTVLGILHIVS